MANSKLIASKQRLERIAKQIAQPVAVPYLDDQAAAIEERFREEMAVINAAKQEAARAALQNANVQALMDAEEQQIAAIEKMQGAIATALEPHAEAIRQADRAISDWDKRLRETIAEFGNKLTELQTEYDGIIEGARHAAYRAGVAVGNFDYDYDLLWDNKAAAASDEIAQMIGAEIAQGIGQLTPISVSVGGGILTRFTMFRIAYDAATAPMVLLHNRRVKPGREWSGMKDSKMYNFPEPTVRVDMSHITTVEVETSEV